MIHSVVEYFRVHLIKANMRDTRLRLDGSLTLQTDIVAICLRLHFFNSISESIWIGCDREHLALRLRSLVKLWRGLYCQSVFKGDSRGRKPFVENILLKEDPVL